MGYPYFDQEMFRSLYLGLPSLKNSQWLELAKELSEDEPYSYLKVKSSRSFLKQLFLLQQNCIHRKWIKS